MSFWLDPQLDLQNRIPQMSSVTHLALSSALAMGPIQSLWWGWILAMSMAKAMHLGLYTLDPWTKKIPFPYTETMGANCHPPVSLSAIK